MYSHDIHCMMLKKEVKINTNLESSYTIPPLDGATTEYNAQ